MKTSILVLLAGLSPVICMGEDPAPVKPTPTPRVIILHHEEMRKSLENDRVSLDKSYSAGKIDRGGYDKGIKEYKAGIDKYRRDSREAAGSSDRAKPESKGDRASKEKSGADKR
jgi:hypothetical protein